MLYDFLCNTCLKVFEVRRKLADESAVICPKCACKDTRKVFLTTPHIEVSWRRSLGLGHSGQISLAPVKNKVFRAVRKQGELHG